MIKISVITDISVTWFYGYIGYIGKKISYAKIWSKLMEIWEKLHTNVIRNIIDNLKLFCWRIWYVYDIIYDIKCNYIMSIEKKCEFCNCTLIMKLHERLDFIKYQ